MQSSFETILTEIINNHILLVTFNRPKFANAFNTMMSKELTSMIEDLSMSPDNIRAIILTGSGEKAFCAGGDLKERNGMSDDDWGKQHLVYERMIRALIDCPIPIIGAINGAAYGGGCEIAAALDFIYVSENAKFALPELGLGIIPGAGGTQNLSRAVGERRAKELILTGRVFSAKEAVKWNLANDVFPIDMLLEKTIEIANLISSKAPIAVKQAKQSIHKGLQMSLSDGLSFEIEAYNRTIPTKDRIEGVLAFNEKRKPKFEGK
jgi:enoyl-CoA hydratase/carnithine racemase